MIKTVFSVDGMACSMCEAHVNDAVRKVAGKVKKVTSSHSKGTCEVISDGPLDEAAVRQALEGIGYRVTVVESEPYEKKKGMFSFGR
jgi:copper chaperone CopZ